MHNIELWCLMSLSTIFQLYCGSVQSILIFIGGGNLSTFVPGENHRPAASC